MPSPDFRSRHELRVDAPPEAVARAMETYRLDRDGSLPTKALIRLRGLRVPGGRLRDALRGSGFALIAERPGEEVVFAVTGKFWALLEADHLETPADLDSFRSYDVARSAAAALSLRIEPLPDGSTLLSTETRVRGTDATGRRRFRRYWLLIHAFSGLIRRDFLKGIGRLAVTLADAGAVTPAA